MRLSKSSMAQKRLKSPVGWGQSVTQKKPTDSLLQLVAVTKESAVLWEAYSLEGLPGARGQRPLPGALACTEVHATLYWGSTGNLQGKLKANGPPMSQLSPKMLAPSIPPHPTLIPISSMFLCL